MTVKITMAALVLTMLLCASLTAAQDNAQQDGGVQKNDSSRTSSQGTETLTGCIVRGDAVDRYRFAAKDGTVWDVVRGTKEKLKMESYVGHTVTAAGKLTPNPYNAKIGANASAVKRDVAKNHAGTLAVTKLTIVSATCAQ
jgi:hypothetical protein